MIDVQEVTVSSFLASCLLKTKLISFLQFSDVMSNFSYERNIELIEPSDDFNKLQSLVGINDHFLYLKKDYTEKLEDSSLTVLEYLYSLTTDVTRDYFKIEINENDKRNKIIKRTKVHH